MTHALSAQLDASLAGDDSRQCATTPLGMDGAVRQRVLIDQTIEVVFQLAGDFGRSPRERAIHQSLRAVAGKTMDPLAQGSIGKLERVGDGLQTLPFDDVVHGLCTAKDAGFFRLF